MSKWNDGDDGEYDGMTIDHCPRILVISINCFSKSGSNGRVLGTLFSGWDTSNLAQFYIFDELPDLPVCNNYFRITDRECLKSFLTRKKYGHRIELVNNAPAVRSVMNQIGGTRFHSVKRLIRDLIWSLDCWKSKELYAWMENFSPELILLLGGGSSFLPKFAMELSEKYSIPIALYNTESYTVNRKTENGHGIDGLAYKIYRRRANNTYKKLLNRTAIEIHNTDMLAALFEKAYGKKGHVIYQSTQLQSFASKTPGDSLVLTYTGNLDLDRHKSLIEIGETLYNISDSLILDVYGKAKNETIENELKDAKGIRFHGFVNYDEVLNIMENSDLLFHAESFLPERIAEVKTGFSTKIPDSLASNRCLVLYADKSIACAEYLIKNNCAFVITSKQELEFKLRQILVDPVLRDKIAVAGVKIAEQNHNAKRNGELFKELLTNAVLP